MEGGKYKTAREVIFEDIVVKILKNWLKKPILTPGKLQISSRMFFKAHYLYEIYQRNREHLKSGQREKNIHVKRESNIWILSKNRQSNKILSVLRKQSCCSKVVYSLSRIKTKYEIFREAKQEFAINRTLFKKLWKCVRNKGEGEGSSCRWKAKDRKINNVQRN